MAETAHSFIGRSQELIDLRRLHAEPGCHIAVLYGRRRVGKTALVNVAFEGELMLSFEGLEEGGKREQIKNFLFLLERQTELRIARKSSIRSWREAFIELVPAVRDKHVVILLDELQWMANYRNDLVANLKLIWEQFLTKSARITLVLCGSVASFMKRKVLKSKALYGRTDLEIHLTPFDLSNTRRLLVSHSVDDVLLAQLLVGGVPKYLNLLNAQPSIAMGLDRLAFSPNGFFYEEFERIFVSHFGDSEIYRRIIELLAQHPGGLSRASIQERLKLSSGGALTRQLSNMESAGFIAALAPFDNPDSAQLARFALDDPFMRFYFDFLLPYKKERMFREHYFTNIVLPSQKFSSWLGCAFELLCLQHRARIAQILGFSGIHYTAGPYFQRGKSAGPSGAQLDLVFDRGDRVLTVCEVKFREEPIGVEVIREMQEKLARIAQFAKRTVQKVLITRSPPSAELDRSSYFSRIVMAEELVAP